MPLAKPCAGGCGAIIPIGQRHCANCARADSTRRRRKPTWGVYQSAAWRGPNGVRNQALQRDNHTCQHCGRPATHVHHVVAITDCEAAGIDVYDLDILRRSAPPALAEPTHRAHTARVPLPSSRLTARGTGKINCKSSRHLQPCSKPLT